MGVDNFQKIKHDKSENELKIFFSKIREKIALKESYG